MGTGFNLVIAPNAPKRPYLNAHIYIFIQRLGSHCLMETVYERIETKHTKRIELEIPAMSISTHQFKPFMGTE